ncbi:MAG: hypothetical protein COT24_02965 [Candidatus Kerfeldbacteria bacterium CG08_land_8_20_14_0_20_40_16]|uniref:Uncharacterized protein n=1 Tax=Candidatus Kerfeldbacteria bacterium CG08_land_8_20_14_0_20_40_16 TaxID=2014244 RepID=A0A2H0YW87_9BACT|nr:MAG: hypothetical protein COT24_02965 [Candidatus Kerfeldbacteria bacterium CG08_land_8_20_14_0_20_40_16]
MSVTKVLRMTIGLLLIVALLTACSGGNGQRVACTYQVQNDGSTDTVIRNGTTCSAHSPYPAGWIMGDELIRQEVAP